MGNPKTLWKRNAVKWGRKFRDGEMLVLWVGRMEGNQDACVYYEDLLL